MIYIITSTGETKYINPDHIVWMADDNICLSDGTVFIVLHSVFERVVKEAGYE